MPIIRQRVEHQRVSTGIIATMPVNPLRVTKPRLNVVKPRMSAIEYIVENAHPGEVVYVDEADYYNEYLWSRYEGLKSAPRYKDETPGA